MSQKGYFKAIRMYIIDIQLDDSRIRPKKGIRMKYIHVALNRDISSK